MIGIIVGSIGLAICIIAILGMIEELNRPEDDDHE